MFRRLALQATAADGVKRLGPNVTMTTKTYPWGSLQVIGVQSGKGRSDTDAFTIPLHPQDRTSLLGLEPGKSLSFRDETSTKWDVTRNGDKLSFSCPGTGKVNVPVSALSPA